MFEIRTNLSRRKISEVASELNYVSSDTFLRGLALNTKAQDALTYLKSIFPVGSSGHTLREFGLAHLVQGFTAKPIKGANGVGIIIEHKLWGEGRGRTVLRSLDTGHGAYEYEVQEETSFKADASSWSPTGKKSKSKDIWVRLIEGQIVVHQPRAGIHYVDLTKRYIESEILPYLREEFSDKVAARMRKLGHGEIE